MIALRVVALLERLHHQPSALVVHDVRADLADHRRIAVAVEVVVLDLEELAEQLADLVRLGVRRLVGHAAEMHRGRRG